MEGAQDWGAAAADVGQPGWDPAGQRVAMAAAAAAARGARQTAMDGAGQTTRLETSDRSSSRPP